MIRRIRRRSTESSRLATCRAKALGQKPSILAAIAANGVASVSQGAEAIDAGRFVDRYAAAWAARDGDAIAQLWDPSGDLIDPLYDRPLKGAEIAALTRSQLSRTPDLKWTLVRWAAQGDSVVMEFRNEFTVAGKPFERRGVDWMRLANGRIVEERVYLDTAKLRAAANGHPPEPIVRLPTSPADQGTC